MVKKDFTSQENIDHEKNPIPPGEEGKEATTQPEAEPGKTYVKNANATGDGAFGHTETGVPDEDEMDVKKESDPPY